MATKKSLIQLFEDHYKILIFLLPMKDATFVTDLMKQNLITVNIKSKLDSLAKSTEKASYFLDNVIKPGLAVVDSTCFVKLLSVMKNCNHDTVKDLAEQIETGYDVRCKLRIFICTLNLNKCMHIHTYIVMYVAMYMHTILP